MSDLPDTQPIITPKEPTMDEKIITRNIVTGKVNEGVPTPIANPTRATIRTTVQAVIGLVLIANPLAGAVIAYLQEQTDLEVSPIVFVILNAVVAITAFVIGLAARIMAVPGVAAFIQDKLPWLAPIKR